MNDAPEPRIRVNVLPQQQHTIAPVATTPVATTLVVTFKREAEIVFVSKHHRRKAKRDPRRISKAKR